MAFSVDGEPQTMFQVIHVNNTHGVGEILRANYSIKQFG